MITKISLFILCVFNCSINIIAQKKLHDDNIFPPATVATARVINFDNKGFIINGQRTFITSGSIHYPRVPQENWHDVLLKLKRSGFNCVETYAFWNFHEPKEGVFDFTSPGHDLAAFIDEAKKVGLYVILRVGPYVCAEWENGGFPTWLIQKEGVEVRKDNKLYLEYVTKWFNKLLPIVAQRQIHKGGNIILVQLENEMPTNGWRYWGTESDGNHMNTLMKLAKENGLEVPMFYSGLNHAHDPAPKEPVNPETRTSPWMSTELWTTWFDKYGNRGEDLKQSTRHPWRVLANGGNGFNLYMFHGGTSFVFYNFNDDIKYGDKGEKVAASYDYGTLIGQAGETRILYNQLKRLGYFAASFSSILANSTNSTEKYKQFAEGMHVTARTSPAGTLVFVDNTAKNDTIITLNSGTTVKMVSGEIAAFPVDYALSDKVIIKEADTRILSIVPQKGLTTIICYGETGDKGKITFSANTKASFKETMPADFHLSKEKCPELVFTYPEDTVGNAAISFGAQRFRILVMNKATADKTWVIDDNGNKVIVSGAYYIGAFTETPYVNTSISYTWNDIAPSYITIFDNNGSRKIKVEKSEVSAAPVLPKLASWMAIADNAALQKDGDDSKWFAASNGNIPVMGQDGDSAAYCWYHARFNNTATIDSLLFNKIGDRALFFLDGSPLAKYNMKVDKLPHIKVAIPAGNHLLSVFVSYSGRNKFFAKTGNINQPKYLKGLIAPLTNEKGEELKFEWKMQGGVNPGVFQTSPATIVTANAGLPVYYKTEFELNIPATENPVYRIATEGLSSGSIWLNGHNIGRYPEIIKGCPGLWLPDCWINKGKNEIIIFDEWGNTPDKVFIKLEAEASRHTIMVKENKR